MRDLAVTADHDRLYVVSLSRRRVVEPVLTHATARHTMPALARLLCEIPLATTAPPAPAVVTSSGPLPVIGREHGWLPGSQALFAKVYGHPDVLNTILTRHRAVTGSDT